MTSIRIFISSVQSEFAQERASLRDYLREDALLRRFFDVFLFEAAPASNRRPDELHLDEVGGRDRKLHGSGRGRSAIRARRKFCKEGSAP